MEVGDLDHGPNRRLAPYESVNPLRITRDGDEQRHGFTGLKMFDRFRRVADGRLLEHVTHDTPAFGV